MIAALVARLTDKRTALVATALAAASWITIYHGIYARMYSLFLFLSALSFLTLLRAVGTRDPRRWAAWIVATVLTIATQPYGTFVLAAQAVYVLARRRRRKFPLRPAAISFGIVVALVAPLWLIYRVLASRFGIGLTGESDSKLGLSRRRPRVRLAHDRRLRRRLDGGQRGHRCARGARRASSSSARGPPRCC